MSTEIDALGMFYLFCASAYVLQNNIRPEKAGLTDQKSSKIIEAGWASDIRGTRK